MNKLASDRIQGYYYNLGLESTMGKTASASRDLLRLLGGGAAYTAPAVGALAGAGLGGVASYNKALSVVDRFAERGPQGVDALTEVIFGLPVLGALVGASTVGGGVLGHSAGKSARDLIRSKLYPAGRGRL
jgi:hypothetical protein